MAGSILNNYLEDPPEPGSNHPTERIRASLTLSSSVASVAHSFTASYNSTPELYTGVPQFDDASAQIDLWVSSADANGFTLVGKSFGAVSASNTGSILVDVTAEPDLS